MILLLSKFRNFKPLAIFCACTAWFVLNLLKNHIVGFLMWPLKVYNDNVHLIQSKCETVAHNRTIMQVRFR